MQATAPSDVIGGPTMTPAYDLKVYRIYWSAIFGTFSTFAFALASTLSQAWAKGKDMSIGYEYTEVLCVDSGWVSDEDEEAESVCSLLKTARAFQYMATIVVGFTLLLVFIAAMKPAPATGKLGLIAGVLLAFFAVFQLIALSCMAVFPAKFNARYYDPAFAVKLTVGPTLGLGVVSCYLGTAGAAFTLCLRRRATSDRDGPIRAYLNRNSSGVNFAPPPPAGVPPTAGAA